MKETRVSDVLIAFQNRKDDASAVDIARQIYTEKFDEIDRILASPLSEIQEVKRARRETVRLQRRVLYHLNRLADNNIVRIARITETGQKLFALNLSEDEELALGTIRRKRVVITKPSEMNTPIERYVEQKVVAKYGGERWLDSSNAILLDCTDHTLADTEVRVNAALSNVNDVVGLLKPEKLLRTSSTARILHKLGTQATDAGKTLCVVVKLSELNDAGRSNFIDLLKHTNTVNFVLECGTKTLHNDSVFLEQIIEAAGPNKKVHFHNTDVNAAPFIMGRAGPYTVVPYLWDSKKGDAWVIATNTLMVDIKKFCDAGVRMAELDEFMEKLLKTLFYGLTTRRRTSDFDGHQMARSYIRFWNYDWLRLTRNASVMENVFAFLKKRAQSFCEVEETIYKSCGMPLRFVVALSYASSSLSSEYFSGEPDKSRLEIRELKDLYTDAFKDNMGSKERLFQMFDGGFHLTIHKKGTTKSADVLRELKIIESTYNLPFFAYNMETRGRVQNLKAFVVRE